MNRTLLLILADFLLLSLLALARFDVEEEPRRQDPPERAVQAEMAEQQEMMEVLRSSLQSEQAQREALARELSQTRQQSEQTQEQLQQREQDLEQTRQSLEEEARRRAELAAERERLALERARIAEEAEQTRQQLTEVENRTSSLQRNLERQRERTRQIQAELAARQEALEETRQSLDELSRQQRLSEAEREQLRTELRVRETEARILEENLEAARAEIETARTEMRTAQEQAEKLTEVVSEQSRAATEIQSELLERTPISENEIYNRFLNNRVTIRFTGTSSGFLGTRERDYQVRTLIVSDGSRHLALFHASDTPFRLDRGFGADQLTGTLEIGNLRLALGQVNFLASDPRILAVPIPTAALERSGIQATPLAVEPTRFSEAVLIGQRPGLYGESAFRLMEETSRYLRFEGKVFSRLFGEFAPSEGDLVLSKSGGFVGLMVNNRHAAVLDILRLGDSLELGDQYNADRAQATLEAQRQRLERLPSELR